MHADRSTPPGEELRIRLLGDFAVTVGYRQVDPSHWRLRKAKNLVKMLALAPDHRLHRECVFVGGARIEQRRGHVYSASARTTPRTQGTA